MKSFKRLAILLILIVINSSCSNRKKEQEILKSQNNQIETYLQAQFEFQEIPSLALAVIKKGEVVYEGYFGNTDLKNSIPVSKNTIYPIYSVTKLMVTTGVFQLIEQGKITLEDNISKYINNLPENWESIKIKHLITHSTGLPNFSIFDDAVTDEDLWAKLIKENRHFELGDHFEYNQTNFWIISKIIEKVTGLAFENYILNNQFADVNSGIVFSSDFTEHIPNRVKRYDYDNNKKKYINLKVKGGKRCYPANGLNLTLSDLIEWNKQLDDNTLLKEKTKEKMWSSFEYGNKANKFQHGWHNYSLQNTTSYGFTGGTHTGFRKFVEKDMTIVLLTNGYKYYPNHNEIIDHIAGIIENDLKDENAALKNEIIALFFKKDFDDAVLDYKKLKANKLGNGASLDFENALNTLGYIFINQEQIENLIQNVLGYNLTNQQLIEKAIKIFELNIQEHPESANCYDSLGEAYLKNKQLDQALKNYKKAFDLNPKNTNAKEVIKKITKIKNSEKVV